MASIRDMTDMTERSAELLRDAGIRTLEQLLEAGATSTGRMSLADEAHLDDQMIKRWVHQADLLRIKGIGPDFAELLCLAGVCTTPKLAYRTTDSLYIELAETNDRYHVVRRLPSRHELSDFITDAKRLPKLIHH